MQAINTSENGVEEVKNEITSNLETLKKFHESLFVSTYGGKLKAGRVPHCKFDESSMQQLNGLLGRLDMIQKKLDDELLHVTFRVSVKSHGSSSRDNKRKYNNSWKTKKQRAVAQRRNAEMLFLSLGGELLTAGHFEPAAGVPQICDLSIDQLIEVINNRDYNLQALKVLVDNECFRGSALDSVLSYLGNEF